MKSTSDTNFVLFQSANGFRTSLCGCFPVFAVPARLVLVLVSLMWCFAASAATGEALVDRPVTIQTYAGETVILPCHISVSDGDDAPSSVEWSKQGLKPNIAFLYRQGCETFDEKNPVFRYRTNLIMNELKNGNLSLRLSNVSLSDEGKYICKMIQRPPRVLATVELRVVAISKPKLSVVPTSHGGVTLQCEVDCWSPRPSITFLDAQGNVISTGDTKTVRDDGRQCFSATRRLAVQTADRFTCRVDQDETNQTRVAGIYIPDDCVRSCCRYIIIISVTATIIICACLCAFIASLYKQCGDTVDGRKLQPQSSQQSSTRSSNEGHNLRTQAEQAIQKANDELRREIAKLKLNLNDKEEIILRKTEELNDLRSKLSPVVCHHGEPVIGSSPSQSSPVVPESINRPREDFPHDKKTKPAASTKSTHPKSDNVPQNKDSRPGPQIQEKPLGRSRSVSGPRSPSKHANLERRYTISVVGGNNRFSVLEHVPEDSEPLL